MKTNRRALLMMTGLTVVLVLLGASIALGALKAVPPDQFVPPSWVPADQAAEFQETYRRDYEADLSDGVIGATSPADPRQAYSGDLSDYELSFVAPEWREEVAHLLMAGKDVQFRARPDGLVEPVEAGQ